MSLDSYYTLYEGATTPDVIKRQAKIPELWSSVTSKRDTMTFPKVRCTPPDAGKSREIGDLQDEIVAINRKFWAKNKHQEDRLSGRYLAPHRRLFTISGHVGMAVYDERPGDRYLGWGGNFSQPIVQIGADVWRAYARVRTCKSRGGRVDWILDAKGLTLTADDGLGNTAIESVDVATYLPDTVRQIRLEDAIVWLLRGREWLVYQQAPDDGKPAVHPIVFEHAEGYCVVIQPMKGGGGF